MMTDLIARLRRLEPASDRYYMYDVSQDAVDALEAAQAEVEVANKNAEAFNQQNQRLAVILDKLEADNERLRETCAEMNSALEDERDEALADNERLTAVYEAAKALCRGHDWNKGTMALRHGYRQKLIDAVAALADTGETDNE